MPADQFGRVFGHSEIRSGFEFGETASPPSGLGVKFRDHLGADILGPQTVGHFANFREP